MLGGISPIQLVIVLVIVILIFGTKKIRNMGKDIGGAVKGFKDGMNDPEDKPADDADPGLTHKREQTRDADFNQSNPASDKEPSERKD